MLPVDLPARIANRYRTIRLIGRGGMGFVYEVEHEHTGERLALKLLTAQVGASRDTISRFKREARASARINSEHVVRVTDAGVAEELEDTPFIVMELLAGMTLEQATAGKAQTPHVAVAWLRQVAKGVDKAHRLGIVHRDLKPENLFLTQREDGTQLVKILDFGLVKMLSEQGTTTASGDMLGTPMYMSPEQVNGPGAQITQATDLYAIGLIAHRLLTGRHYREGETLAHVVVEMLRGETPAPSTRGSTLGSAFDRWFARACHLDPTARFATAGEQIEELAIALGLPQLPCESSPDVDLASSPSVALEGGFRSSFRKPRRGLLGGGILATVFLIALFTALLVARGDRRAVSPNHSAAVPAASSLPDQQAPARSETTAVPAAPSPVQGPSAGSAAPAASPSPTRTEVTSPRTTIGRPKPAKAPPPRPATPSSAPPPTTTVDPLADQK